MTRVVAITQARMSSRRLPGKALRLARGRALLSWHLERLKRCRLFTEVVVATTMSPADEVLLRVAEQADARWFRGSEEDVLSRYLGAAREIQADVVVRVTADCPLWDPQEGGRVVEALLSGSPADYASNCLEPTYPRGLDTEVLWRDVLERVGRLAHSGPEREHVTWLIHKLRPDLFVRRSVTGPGRADDLRWCVDTTEDLACVTALLEGLADPLAPYPDVLRFARAHPEIARLNAGVAQRS